MKTPAGAPAHWIEQHLDFPDDECLIWPFSRNSNGYAKTRIGKSTLRVHRVMCEHRHGPRPTPKHETAHSCGKGHLGCVNPQHLSWKTRKENHADKLIHGTAQRGERHPMVKLTEADILAIRSTSGVPQWKIAERYGVGQAQISSIMRREYWAWLP